MFQGAVERLEVGVTLHTPGIRRIVVSSRGMTE